MVFNYIERFNPWVSMTESDATKKSAPGSGSVASVNVSTCPYAYEALRHRVGTYFFASSETVHMRWSNPSGVCFHLDYSSGTGNVEFFSWIGVCYTEINQLGTYTARMWCSLFDVTKTVTVTGSIAATSFTTNQLQRFSPQIDAFSSDATMSAASRVNSSSFNWSDLRKNDMLICNEWRFFFGANEAGVNRYIRVRWYNPAGTVIHNHSWILGATDMSAWQVDSLNHNNLPYESNWRKKLTSPANKKHTIALGKQLVWPDYDKLNNYRCVCYAYVGSLSNPPICTETHYFDIV
jgi:hypothetical protein